MMVEGMVSILFDQYGASMVLLTLLLGMPMASGGLPLGWRWYNDVHSRLCPASGMQGNSHAHHFMLQNGSACLRVGMHGRSQCQHCTRSIGHFIA